MNEGQRRIFLFAATLVVGLVLVFLDIPVLVMLGVLVVVGLLFLFMTGALTPADLALLASRLRRPKPAGDVGTAKAEKGPRRSFLRRKEKDLPEVGAAPPAEKKKRGPLFAGLRETFRGLRGGRERRKAAVKNAAAAAEPAAAGQTGAKSLQPSPTPVAGAAPAPSTDPFLTLSDDELQADLLDDLDGLDSLEMPPIDEGRPASAGASPVVELELDSMPDGGDAFDDAAAAILAAHATDLEEFTDLEGVEEIENELASLDESDFADAELDGLEIDAGEMAALSGAEGAEALIGAPGASDALPDFSVTNAVAPQSAAPEESSNDMAAFAAGMTGSDGDMLSLLASDVKKVRVKQDLSLLRDLKDVRVSSEDLADELEGVLHLLGGAAKPDRGESPSSPRPSSR